MTKNPILNALGASAYIVVVASLMYYGPKLLGPDEPKDAVLVPIAFLSLFVLSAATMAYVFFYHPLLLYVEGQKQQAVELFLRTVGFFALITGVIFFIAFLVL